MVLYSSLKHQNTSVISVKIFITVGAQIAFNRLVKTVDKWVGEQDLIDAFAQVGPDGYRPNYMDWAEFLTPEVYREKVRGADLLVSHAGMGSIITALQFGKPIIILPRHAKFHETRNDHQVATAEHFSHIEGIYAAFDESDLVNTLQSMKEFNKPVTISSYASPELLEKIRKFIHGN